jgi:uncharacterized protein YdeI (YjbR/CyaY-like superfamily)
MTTIDTIFMSSLENWRSWLQENSQSNPGIWLMFLRTSSGHPCISYDDALDEALCFGWIDSIIKKIDAERYVRKFTPRTNLTNWSAANKRRVFRLIDQGRMQAVGLAKIGDLSAFAEQPIKPRPTLPELPTGIEQAIRENSGAWEYWETLAVSHRREYIWWLTSAKRPETLARRLSEAIKMLEDRRQLGLK